jgi:sulfite exporter TauE/SafE
MVAIALIGFSIGFLGSFHCVGMCGPIALSLPIMHETKAKRLLLIFLYNIGRATTYAGFGALVGMVSNRFFLTGYQQVLSIVLGCLILVVLIAGKFMNLETTIFKGFHLRVQGLLAKYLHGQKNTAHFYIIGAVNGLLPCGLLYMGIAAAAATGSILHATWLMFAFGLGTLPLMFSLMIVGRAIPITIKQQMRKALPYCVGLMACLLILRGMNLGIPFVSPIMHHAGSGVISCH